MRALQITSIQRIHLDGLLAAQKGSLGELEVLGDIRDKVKLSDGEKATCLKDIPGGQGALIDISAANLIPMIGVALENTEATVLGDLLRSWPHFSTQDLEWLRPLSKAVRDAATVPTGTVLDISKKARK